MLNKIYNMDCLEGMKMIPDKSIDMILCDLPYGKTAHPEDKPLPFEPLWEQYKRIIKANGAIVLFAQGLFYVDLVNSNRKMFRYDFSWDKVLTSGFLNANKMPLRQHEQIAVFYKKKTTYNPQYSVGKPNHSKGKPKTNKNNNYGAYNFVDNHIEQGCRKHPTSILRFSKPHPSKAIHRTEKPIPLLEFLVRTYTNEGETVLDNCIGSGGTAVACINTKRNYIGFEISGEIYEATTQRIATHINKNTEVNKNGI